MLLNLRHEPVKCDGCKITNEAGTVCIYKICLDYFTCLLSTSQSRGLRDTQSGWTLTTRMEVSETIS